MGWGGNILYKIWDRLERKIPCAAALSTMPVLIPIISIHLPSCLWDPRMVLPKWVLPLQFVTTVDRCQHSPIYISAIKSRHGVADPV